MTGLSQLLFGKDPQQAQERVTRDTAVASTVLTELFYCMNLLCFSKQLLKFVRLIPNSSPPRRREAIVVSLYPPGSAMSLPHSAKRGQQICCLCSYLLCGADGACDTLELHPERWSWPRPRSLQWPPLPATDEKSSSAATAPAPASAGCSGSRSRTGCRPSPGEKPAALGRGLTGKSAGLTQLQQNPPANNGAKGSTTKSTITETLRDLLGTGSKTNSCAS